MNMSSFPKMLKFKQNMVPNPQLLRWSSWFSQYTFDVIRIKGKTNIVADFFSRPLEPSQPKHPEILMYSHTFTIPNPWQKEDFTRHQTIYELEVFQNYGGFILNPFGAHLEYPFSLIFIA